MECKYIQGKTKEDTQYAREFLNAPLRRLLYVMDVSKMSQKRHMFTGYSPFIKSLSLYGLVNKFKRRPRRIPIMHERF